MITDSKPPDLKFDCNDSYTMSDMVAIAESDNYITFPEQNIYSNFITDCTYGMNVDDEFDL